MSKVISTLIALILMSFMFVGAQLQATSIYYCNASQKRCIVQLTEGQKGDSVRVLDEGAHLIDTGKIIVIQNQKGNYGVIELTKTKKERREIQVGFPVIVELERANSNLMWGNQIKRKK